MADWDNEFLSKKQVYLRLRKISEDYGNSVDKQSAVLRCIDAVMEMPAEDVVPVVHARWKLSQRIAGGAHWECSLCGREIETNILKKLHRFPYCHCGAKMDMSKEGE